MLTERVAEIVSRYSCISKQRLVDKPETTLEIDSLDAVEIAMDLEEMFEIAIADDALKWETFDDVLTTVKGLYG